MKSKGLRISLRTKFILIFAAILLIAIGGIAVANRILLPRLYEQDKRKALIRAYNAVNSLSSVENELELDKISTVDGITVYICDENGDEVFSSARDARNLLPGFRDYPGPDHGPGRWGDGPDKSQPDESLTDTDQTETEQSAPADQPPTRPEDGEWRDHSGRVSLIETAGDILAGEKYVIRFQKDERLANAFLGLIARLDNGNYLFLQTTMAPVDEAAQTANELLMFIGIVALILGIVIVFVAASAATRPIRQLTEIAGAVSALDFSRKYEGKSKDEVGELGRSVNIMSSRLEENINELREKNDRLEKDIELKDSIDRMRKEFIANASHELKTPIALIGGYAEGLKENIAVSPENRDFYCDVIIDEANRMDKIIKQILTIAELESAETATLEKAPLDMTALVEGAVRSFELLARQKGATIEADCGESIEITADEAAITQAVDNYITNAIHHVDDSGIIRVSLRREGERVRYGVYNSGAPIPEGAEEQIWESFGKLDKARTRAYGGSGLGLAIVKKCVELHGGSCGFINTDGGVEFYFIV